MGRAALALGTADCDPRVLDGSTPGMFSKIEEPSGDSAIGFAGAGTLLPCASAPESWSTPKERNDSETDVTTAQLWSQLSLSERERFGHCFSCLVLKAVGLRSCLAEEVEP